MTARTTTIEGTPGMEHGNPAFRRPMRTISALLMVPLSVGCARAPAPATGPESPAPAQELLQPAPTPFDLPSYTRNQPACLLVTDASGKPIVRTDPKRCAERFLPCSTFKIPNSIIGLETGVLQDANTVIPWDQDKYPKQAWWPKSWTDREHDLRSAFHESFVPFYRELATRVGSEPMQRYLTQFEYGNQSIGGSLDSFWLDGDIAVSADEQVKFLRAFYEEKLGVSPRTTRIVKDILVHERSGDYVLSAKTGTGDSADGTAIGWLVGYVQHDTGVHYYAFNVSGKTYDDIGRTWRFETLKKMLSDLRLWPRAPSMLKTL